MFDIENNENVDNNESKNTSVKKESKATNKAGGGLKIALIVSAIVLVLVLIPILIDAFKEKDHIPENVPDTGITLDGSYAMTASTGAFAGSSVYTFDGNKVTNTYSANGERKEVVYTYVIAIENDIKVIKLTTTDENGEEVTTTHDFLTGTFNGRAFISINDVYYYIQETEN